MDFDNFVDRHDDQRDLLEQLYYRSKRKSKFARYEKLSLKNDTYSAALTQGAKHVVWTTKVISQSSTCGNFKI